ncbi:MAG: response regulator [Pseudomonadota bacterium]|nr:response regulator [Pseudomonadota bacterium]
MVSSAVILVVEDHPIVRLNALDLVRDAGFEGIGAANADEAIRILEARSDVRLVFTDVEMPGTMDGFKLAHYIRDRWPPVHLIVVSGKAMPDQSGLPANTKFFPKPYNDNTIVEELTRLLSSTGHK